MKRLLFAGTLLLLVALPFKISFGFEATSSVGAGTLIQKGVSGEFGYNVGFDIQLVKTGNGWTINNETDFLYSDRDGGEVEVIRTFAITKKSLFGDKTSEGVAIWDFYVSMGTGMWRFINTEAEDATSAAYQFGIGLVWKGVDFGASVDAIQIMGDDLFYAKFGFGFDF